MYWQDEQTRILCDNIRENVTFRMENKTHWLRMDYSNDVCVVHWHAQNWTRQQARQHSVSWKEHTLALCVQKKGCHFKFWTSAEQGWSPVGHEELWTESVFLHDWFTEPLALAERWPESCARPDQYINRHCTLLFSSKWQTTLPIILTGGQQK